VTHLLKHLTVFDDNFDDDLRLGEVFFDVGFLIARPGPGKGWRITSSLGKPKSRPRLRTSSLWKSLRGSTTRPSLRSCRTSSVSLWCVLMTSALALASVDADSMRSGRRVPCPSITSSGRSFSSRMISLEICFERQKSIF
jgi:hypothetical protein